jgi:hypothetical protein
MNIRRNIIFIVLAVFAILALVVILTSSSTNSSKPGVNFILDNDSVSVSVFDKDDNLVVTIEESKSVDIESGVYRVEISATDDQETTNNNVTVPDYKLDYVAKSPPYKESYLEKYLEKNKQKITNSISSIKNEKEAINEETIFGDGARFYHLSLLQNADNGTVRRLILEEKDDQWVVLTEPRYAISKYDVPEYAIDAARAVNYLEIQL